MSNENEAALAAARETGRQLVALKESGNPSTEQIDAAFANNVQTTAMIEKIPNRPPPVKNAQYYGAKGDGVTDDTAALQTMFDTGLAIFDRPAVYLIDPLKRVSILRNATEMKTLPDPGLVKFVGKANAAPKYRIFNVNASDCGLDVGGAHFIGDRWEHTYARLSQYGTHEWGYPFFLGGARNELFGNGGCLFTGGTGDGLGVTGPDHRVHGLVLDGNRRQGCSAFNATRLEFFDNVCRNTGNNGLTDPAGLIGPFCGFDAEPDGGDCLDLYIHHNTFGPNNRSGAIFWVNSRAGVVRLSGRVHDNTFVGNSNGSWLCDEVAGRWNIAFEFLRNRFVNNKNTDIKCDQGSVVKIGDATDANANIFDDFQERTDRVRTGVFSPEIQALRGAKVAAGRSIVV